MAEFTPTMRSREADPDYALIQAIATGDARALDELYARHGPGLLSYLTAYTSDRQLAEEVLQDVMLAVWENAGGFRGDSKVRTWLLVIARNRALNAQRRKMPDIVSIDDVYEPASGDTEPLERLARKTERALLRAALDKLPSVHREILVLVFYHQLSGAEVAEVLGINIGTVKSRLHRAKEALRRVMQMMGDASDA
jgi:RNA polymerase sigma-70 factor (ECF subfamily)